MTSGGRGTHIIVPLQGAVLVGGVQDVEGVGGDDALDL